jgi:hypothetical protein
MAVAGAAAGFVSGLTGVGGGVFLSPIPVGLGWFSARGAAAISPPFILCNSIVGLAGVWLAGQRPVVLTPLCASGALAGAIVGAAIGTRWMSERATRAVLAGILFFVGLWLIIQCGARSAWRFYAPARADSATAAGRGNECMDLRRVDLDIDQATWRQPASTRSLRKSVSDKRKATIKRDRP